MIKWFMSVISVITILGILWAVMRLNTIPAPTQLSPSISPTPTLKPFTNYIPPSIIEAEAYTIIFVGDSMTDALGENFDYLREYLAEYYDDKVFGLFNYGFGGTNILSVVERLNTETNYRGKTFPAISDRGFDVIVIESFGHNPLSELPLEEGLRIQEEELMKIVTKLYNSHPNSIIMFMATIAPSKTHYAKGERDLSLDQRAQWAEERIAYIENHIRFAEKHNIPLINVYEKSVDEENNAILDYVSKDAYIHPSSVGLQLISQEIFISLREVLPR